MIDSIGSFNMDTTLLD